MENGVQKKSNSNLRTIVVTLTAFSVLASSGLVYQQYRIQSLQSALDHANAVVASQDYKTELSWERLLCAEKQGISPDEVFAAYHTTDTNNDSITIKLQCGAETIENVKEFRITEILENN